MKTNKIIILILIIIFSSINSYCFKAEFSGTDKEVIAEVPATSTGLQYVYVVYDMKDVAEMRIKDINIKEVSGLQIYSNLGGGYGQDVAFTISGDEIIVSNPKGECGYIISTASGSQCFWVVDYSQHVYSVDMINLSDKKLCDTTEFDITGNASPIRYYSIVGMPCILSREIRLTFDILQYDEVDNDFATIQSERIFESLESSISITPALTTQTDVIISGDRFLSKWNLEKRAQTYVGNPNGLLIETNAQQSNLATDEYSNQIKNDGDMLGGSAPAEFKFSAIVSDAVIHTEWQISDREDFESIKYRFNEKDLTYTFYDEGTYYVRFIGSNEDGSCEKESDVYTIGIGASDLRIPNAFSPNGDGVNDEWKVGYISLIEFKCWIFDKNGHQLFYFDDPAQGWDGKYKGKYVNPGVYYYVIEAKGADGKKYKRGGDINIVGYKKIDNRQ